MVEYTAQFVLSVQGLVLNIINRIVPIIMFNQDFLLKICNKSKSFPIKINLQVRKHLCFVLVLLNIRFC